MRSAALLLILAGAALLGLWVHLVWYPGPPLEEPADLGRTPNPSATPWTYDPVEEEREYRLDRLKRRLVFYGLPAGGLVLVALGAAGLATRERVT